MSKSITLSKLKTALAPLIVLIGKKAETPSWSENDPTSKSYIADRPFYTATGLQTTILPEQEVSPDTSVHINESLIVGQTYIVTFNGVNYSCVCREYDGYRMLGNNAIYEYDGDINTDTGEPFACETEGDLLGMFFYFSDQIETDPTVKITTVTDSKVVKIPPEYLPEMSNVGKEGSGKNAEIFNDYNLNEASGEYAHAEGYGTMARAEAAHAEGHQTNATGVYSHAEGYNTSAYGFGAHAEGYGQQYSITISGNANTTTYTKTSPNYIYVGDIITIDLINFATITKVDGSTITVSNTLSNTAVTNINAVVFSGAFGSYSHAEGYQTIASGNSSHAEGYCAIAGGTYSHAEGQSTNASGSRGSHAEGRSTVASGESSHAEGYITTASGQYTHAEGYNTAASSTASHAEGEYTKASGQYSHAEGSGTVASGLDSHAEGWQTIAAGKYQHAQGRQNIADTENKYIHIVGNGTSNTNRSNAHTLDWNGNAWFAGNVKVGGTNQDDENARELLATLPITESDNGKVLGAIDGKIELVEVVDTTARENVNQLSKNKADKFTVGDGLQMDGETLGVVPEGVYELIETITIDAEGIRRYDRTKTPDGLNYSFKKLMVKIISEAHESAVTVAFSAYIDNNFYLYDYQPNTIRKNFASICREFFTINTDGTAEVKSIVGSAGVAAVGMTNSREYKQAGIDTNASIVKLIMSADGADIPVGTVIEIWGVRANA